jgi:hypothetical protein
MRILKNTQNRTMVLATNRAGSGQAKVQALHRLSRCIAIGASKSRFIAMPQWLTVSGRK